MGFTTIGRVVAGVTIVLGIFVFAMGLIAMGNPDGFVQNYPETLTPDRQIESGLTLAFFGLILGVLSDISRSLMSKIDHRHRGEDA